MSFLAERTGDLLDAAHADYAADLANTRALAMRTLRDNRQTVAVPPRLLLALASWASLLASRTLEHDPADEEADAWAATKAVQAAGLLALGHTPAQIQAAGNQILYPEEIRSMKSARC